jgi:tRNA(Ile)-lysidine synthase
MRGKGPRLTLPDRTGQALARIGGPPPWRVLVALSGGADSTGLLAALAALTAAPADDAPVQEGSLSRADLHLTACHVDHGARGAEDQEAEAFCRELCEILEVPLIVQHVKVKASGKGFEDAARRERYAALEAARRDAGARWVLTAHTADDVAETVLWRLARGASSRGLGGIPERAEHLVRPLLDVRRAELREWLSDLEAVSGLVTADRPRPWVEDSTNADPAFLRNRVRAEVLPPLCDAVPQAVESIALAARLLREDGEYLDTRAREALLAARVGQDSYSADGIAALPAPIARRAIRVALVAAGVPADDLTSRHLILVLDGLEREGFALDLPGGVKATVRRGLLKAMKRPGGAT